MLKQEKFPHVDSEQLFSRVAHREWAMFFDSGLKASQSPPSDSHRYDVLAINPVKTIVCDSNRAPDSIAVNDRSGEHDRANLKPGDPLTVLQQELQILSPLRSDENYQTLQSTHYLPGAYGYFSYDLARQFETIPSLALNDEQLPEMAVGIYDVVVVIDHEVRETTLIGWLSNSAARTTMQEWRRFINELASSKMVAGGMPLATHRLAENLNFQQYQARFDRVRDYTVAGDCYQVNLTKRFSCEVSGSTWATYCRLRQNSPAPYGAFLRLPFAEVLSNSPESFIQCRNRAVSTRPIKGTRPRDHQNRERDKEIARDLARSAKDRAENLMIVDLMRNDLSRCCEVGTVKVPSLFALHSFANVHHLISTVTGRLRSDLHVLDLLRSCFPGGSITGAPKIRAMEIIEELEPHRRGLYCGAIGYVGADGSLETNIAIRTIVVKDGVARFSAGGGLVIDSDVNDEYQELIDKASMMKSALFPETIS